MRRRGLQKHVHLCGCLSGVCTRVTNSSGPSPTRTLTPWIESPRKNASHGQNPWTKTHRNLHRNRILIRRYYGGLGSAVNGLQKAIIKRELLCGVLLEPLTSGPFTHIIWFRSDEQFIGHSASITRVWSIPKFTLIFNRILSERIDGASADEVAYF